MTFKQNVGCSACGRIIPASNRTPEGAYDCPYCYNVEPDRFLAARQQGVRGQ